MDELADVAPKPSVRSRVRILIVTGIRLAVRAEVPFLGVRATVDAQVNARLAPGEADEQGTQERGSQEHSGEVTTWHRGDQSRIGARRGRCSSGLPASIVWHTSGMYGAN